MRAHHNHKPSYWENQQKELCRQKQDTKKDLEESRMAGQPEGEHRSSISSWAVSALPQSTSTPLRVATAAVFLLIAGSLVLFFIGIFNFGYVFGPALLGIGIVLFVLTLLFSGFFWACIREKSNHTLSAPNQGQPRGSIEGNSISVINQHFDMGMPELIREPPPDYWGHLPSNPCYDRWKDSQCGQRQGQATAIRSGEGPVATSPSSEEPPPSYWEALQTSH
ncbi:hypothetical protein NDU88_005592 [Pleurodeles waltl]|uniref:Uncharacterized protein n=1 Tax=Pleurodeles waltl TaxID=8319 RepID=A0AAV7WYP8_PLEWA|nr:hypothetical protein NDU88_005592 [Pleurodeles waltl]